MHFYFSEVIQKNSIFWNRNLLLHLWMFTATLDQFNVLAEQKHFLLPQSSEWND